MLAAGVSLSMSSIRGVLGGWCIVRCLTSTSKVDDFGVGGLLTGS